MYTLTKGDKWPFGMVLWKDGVFVASIHRITTNTKWETMEEADADKDNALQLAALEKMLEAVNK